LNKRFPDALAREKTAGLHRKIRIMGDRILGCIMILLGGAMLYATSQLKEPHLVDPLGIKAFPFIVAVGAVISGAILLIETYRSKKSRKKTEEQARPLAAMAVLGWMLLMYLLFETLGFATSIGLLLFGLMVFFNRGKWVVNISVAFLFSLFFYIVFTKVIGAPIPRGFLGF